MNGENGPPKLPEIDTPILVQETKVAPKSPKSPISDEDNRSQAIQIITLWQNAAINKQKKICDELQRANDDLRKLTTELEQKQQSLASINEDISKLLIKLSESQEEIQSFRQVLDVLTSSDPAATKAVVKEVIEHYEENRRSNINNSVKKIIDYNKYN